MEDAQLFEYFLHLSGKEFLDVFVAETSLLEGKSLSKGHLGSCPRLENYQSRRTLVKQLYWDY